MKLIIQIPCKNEEEQLPIVVKQIPKRIPGIDVIEYQVIDDGSTDNTFQVAKDLGVHHILRFAQNKGLGVAFKEGVDNALKLGADILVNIDADNQYPPKYISDIVQPIIMGTADIVIGDRNPGKTQHFSPWKRFLQSLGNKVVGYAAGIKLRDSVSGFRAYSRNSLLELNVTSTFSYTVDTIVQAVKKGLKIDRIPVLINPPTRKSRLFNNIFHHINQTMANLVRVYLMYNPFKFFLKVSVPFILLGIFGILRFLYYYFFTSNGTGKIQSLVISSIVMQIGLTFLILGIIADLIAKNRFLIEENIKMMKDSKYRK